jgi:hypothetical protein
MTQLGKSLHKGIKSISSMQSMGTKPTITGGNQVSVTPYEGTIYHHAMKDLEKVAYVFFQSLGHLLT